MSLKFATKDKYEKINLKKLYHDFYRFILINNNKNLILEAFLTIIVSNCHGLTIWGHLRNELTVKFPTKINDRYQVFMIITEGIN